MNIYTLKFPDDGAAGALRFDFNAEDAADALLRAHRSAAEIRSARAAELWQGTRKLCTIHGNGLTAKPRHSRFQSA